ncbi:MAG: glutathione S-transferase family protein [Reyranella sp.]|uniref:glutathione S-transferase family protein n=1 Tax=Reyranella sp. TaxID=1929291 RepID=UPI00120ABAD9|nr:glutathione S-transferase family protein [Reyranella sp.]TAJ38546.1 MAG: glutathione S-transferase family protein [Reyranella sp.]
MALVLHAHPFSSYCQKVLIALYENDTPFTLRLLTDADSFAELAKLWPLRLMPVLTDGDEVVREASIIIEHLMLRHPGPARLIPQDPAAALKVRFLDRVFDNYVMGPMQRVVGDALRDAGERDPKSVADAKARLDQSYEWLDGELKGRTWAAGEAFTLADCAAAPSLFYADWVHPIGERFGSLRAYRARLLKRPSFARAVEEARPYRSFFPPGAPDRD